MWSSQRQQAYMKRRRKEACEEGLCIVCLVRPARLPRFVTCKKCAKMSSTRKARKKVK